MSSTNKTTNYELSQYIGTDKPTYLGDYNGDMAKIDAALHTNAGNISTISATATTAATNASTALTNAATADGKADTAQATATAAQSTANSALSKAVANEALLQKFNFTTFKDYEANELVMGAQAGTVNSCSLTLATNSDGSLYKLYGRVAISNKGTGTRSFTIHTSLRPEEEYVVKQPCVANIDNYDNNAVMVVKTNGDIEVKYYSGSSANEVSLTFIPCVLFNTNFGDTE